MPTQVDAVARLDLNSFSSNRRRESLLPVSLLTSCGSPGWPQTHAVDRCWDYMFALWFRKYWELNPWLCARQALYQTMPGATSTAAEVNFGIS